jgi:hypothetical protein
MIERRLGVFGAAAAVVLLAAAGCSNNMEKGSATEKSSSMSRGEAHETHAPESGTPPADRAAGSQSTVAMNGLQWDVPAGLVGEQPANTMRIAQYRIPSGKDGVKDGELAVFFFGAGSGGGTRANLERWAGQFKQEDGSAPMSKATTGTLESDGGLPITTIMLPGRYESSGMGGGPSYNEPGWKLYGAVVEGAGGPWFFKAVGPEPVIDEWQPRLLAMLKGLRAQS